MAKSTIDCFFDKSAPHLNDALPIKHDRIGYSKERLMSGELFFGGKCVT